MRPIASLGAARTMPTAAIPIAANDNHPDRVTRLVAHNGGCSTVSGMVPVTVRRTAANDNRADADVMTAGRVVNDYAQQVAA